MNKRIKGVQIVGIEEAEFEGNGIVSVMVYWGWGYESMEAEAEKEVKALGAPSVVQTGLSAVNIYDRGVCCYEDVRDRNGIGGNWCKVSKAIIVFKDDESKDAWEDSGKLLDVNEPRFNSKGKRVN